MVGDFAAAKITACVFVPGGERCVMIPMQQATGNPIDANSMVPLLMTEDDVKMMAESPEQVMEEMRLRATEVGAVLEAILREPHGEPRWGLNE